MTAPPPRRFKPEPTETTMKTTRKFAPEPVETTTKSSRRFAPTPVETSTKSSRKFAPEPVETTTKSSRRFAPELEETTTKSRRKLEAENVEMTPKASRRFVPEPVEVTTASNRNKPSPAVGNTRGKFSPQPVEVTVRSNRKDAKMEGQDSVWPPQAISSQSTQERDRSRRKFAPQLIETAKRSRKSGDTSPALLPSDKTEATPGQQAAQELKPKPTPTPPKNTPVSNVAQVPQLREVNEARRLGTSLGVQQNSRTATRSHSFRIPDLDPIESSQSEESDPPSLSTSPSSSSEMSHQMYKHATRLRESVDDRFSGYLLRLAARAAEKQLRDQALAAFPNNDYHEPVDHYIDRDSDDHDSSSRYNSDGGRGGSGYTQINWELREMQRHQEKLEKQREKDRLSQDAHMMSSRLSTTSSVPWVPPQEAFFGGNDTSGTPKNIIGGWQKDVGIEQMRNSARPPMLGADIQFPRCPSPEPARFDVTQGSHAVRESMCYLTEQTKPAEPEGLWEGKKPSDNRQSLWSNGNSRPSSRGGLWGGFCVDTGATPPRGPTGLMTPRVDYDSSAFESNSGIAPPRHLPPSPPSSQHIIPSLDEKLKAAKAIEDEYNDEFVTQVFNYLSLGYPSLARKFDEELSKISRIPVYELRQDDHLAAQTRGYIRLGEDEKAREDGITEETCMRWRALRLYIREWARQQPRMAHGETPQPWGTAPRRGSWAW